MDIKVPGLPPTVCAKILPALIEIVYIISWSLSNRTRCVGEHEGWCFRKDVIQLMAV